MILSTTVAMTTSTRQLFSGSGGKPCSQTLNRKNTFPFRGRELKQEYMSQHPWFIYTFTPFLAPSRLKRLARQLAAPRRQSRSFACNQYDRRFIFYDATYCARPVSCYADASRAEPVPPHILATKARPSVESARARADKSSVSARARASEPRCRSVPLVGLLTANRSSKQRRRYPGVTAGAVRQSVWQTKDPSGTLRRTGLCVCGLTPRHQKVDRSVCRPGRQGDL
jgi:hypothetical protein